MSGPPSRDAPSAREAGERQDGPRGAGALAGKAMLVTGGGRGVGRAVAHAAAREGARVLVLDAGVEVDGTGGDPRVAEAAAAEIRATGGEAHAAALDLTAPGAAAEAVARARERLGGLDALVACHGILREAVILRLPDEDLEATLAAHVRANFALTRAAARHMVDARGEAEARHAAGAIVLCASPVAFFGGVRQAALAAASAAVVGLVRSAAAELKRFGVRVNAIAPTARTRQTEGLPMFQGIREDSMSPEHVGPVAAFLCSDAAADVTGEVVGVAGARLYALRVRETAGAFSSGKPFTVAEVAACFREATRAG
jgi:NAD(P)-dependent dehydrogenase (short-subunit alcohol dehydrogenase family)